MENTVDLEIKEEFGDALRNGEKGSTETGGRGLSRRGEADLRGTRRGQAKPSLVGYIQERTVVAEKICIEDEQGHQSQLKRPVKHVGAKT